MTGDQSPMARSDLENSTPSKFLQGRTSPQSIRLDLNPESLESKDSPNFDPYVYRDYKPANKFKSKIVQSFFEDYAKAFLSNCFRSQETEMKSEESRQQNNGPNSEITVTDDQTSLFSLISLSSIVQNILMDFQQVQNERVDETGEPSKKFSKVYSKHEFDESKREFIQIEAREITFNSQSAIVLILKEVNAVKKL